MITHKVIASFGSMDVITQHDVNPGELTRDLSGYYWCNRSDTNVQGPFDSVQDAVRHWTLTRSSSRSFDEHVMNANAWVPTTVCPVVEIASLFKGKLIKLDFKEKKRL